MKNSNVCSLLVDPYTYRQVWGQTDCKLTSQIAWNLTNSDGSFPRRNGPKETLILVTIPSHHDGRSEMSDYKRFTLATNIQVYFRNPRSPWQRGSNENTNRLLRQHFSKGTDLSIHSQAELNRVARQLNERPGKTLAYETPADRFAVCVALTG